MSIGEIPCHRDAMLMLSHVLKYPFSFNNNLLNMCHSFSIAQGLLLACCEATRWMPLDKLSMGRVCVVLRTLASIIVDLHVHVIHVSIHRFAASLSCLHVLYGSIVVTWDLKPWCCDPDV